MARSKYKRKQHNPIHGWLDKVFGGDWLEQDHVEDRKWAAIKDKARRENQDIVFKRGAVHYVPRMKSNSQAVPVAPGLQHEQATAALSNIGLGVPQYSRPRPDRSPSAGLGLVHSVVMPPYRQLQNSQMQCGPAQNPHTHDGGDRLLQARHNDPLVPLSVPASKTQPLSFYQPSTHLRRVSASESNSVGDGSSPPEVAQYVQGNSTSPLEQNNVIGHPGHIHGQAISQMSRRGNSRQPHRSRPNRYDPSSIAPLNELSPALVVSNRHRWTHNSGQRADLLGGTRSSSSSEASAEMENVQSTCSSELRAEDVDDASSIAPSAWSSSVATSRAQVGNMQRTYLEGMVPNTPIDLRTDFESGRRREQDRRSLV